MIYLCLTVVTGIYVVTLWQKFHVINFNILNLYVTFIRLLMLILNYRSEY